MKGSVCVGAGGAATIVGKGASGSSAAAAEEEEADDELVPLPKRNNLATNSSPLDPIPPS